MLAPARTTKNPSTNRAIVIPVRVRRLIDDGQWQDRHTASTFCHDPRYPRHMPLHRVAVIALDQVAPFELGVLCEVFGTERAGFPAYEFALCTPDGGPVH